MKPSSVSQKIDIKQESEDIANKQNNGEIINQIMIANDPLYLVSKEEMQQLLHQSMIALKAPMRKNTINSAYGSGVILSRDIVLTAAHNIYFKQFRQGGIAKGYEVDQQSAKIYLQGNGLKYYEVEDWRYLQQFQTCSKQNEVLYDYALIKLRQRADLPEYDKYLQVCLPCQCIQMKDSSLKLEIYGYPFDQDGGYKNYIPSDKQGKTIQLKQYGQTKANSIIKVQEQRFTLKYTISTVSGQSGSPLIVDQKIIGIHKAGKISEQCNFGRLVTKDLISTILKWCQQLKGEAFKVNQSRQCSHTNKNINKVNKLTSKVGQTIQGTKWLQWLAEKYQNESNYAMALQLYQKSLQIKQTTKGKESVQAANTIHQIGLMYYYQLNYAKALECYTLALQIYERVKGKGCFESANTLNNMGLVYDNQLNYAKALECYTLALQIKERVKGKGCFESAVTLHNMGLVYKNQLNYAKALECYKQSKSIYQNRKTKSKDYGNLLFNMGLLYNKLKDYERAASSFETSLQVYEANNLKDYAKGSAIQLAKCLKILNKPAEMSQIMLRYGLKADQI